MHLDADVRLAAAAGGAARYFADAAGLEHEAVSHLQSAVIAACEEAFEELRSDHPGVDVTLTRRVDRIEVAVSHKQANHAAQSKPDAAADQSFRGVDEVQHETRDAIVVIRLTKFLRQGATRT